MGRREIPQKSQRCNPQRPELLWNQTETCSWVRPLPADQCGSGLSLLVCIIMGWPVCLSVGTGGRASSSETSDAVGGEETGEDVPQEGTEGLF